MKLRSTVAALAVASLALTACGGDEESSGFETPSADASGTLKVWLMVDTPESVYEATTAKFNETYPNVEVTVEPQQWGGIQDKLTTSLGTDSTPDVVEIGNSLTAKYIDAGLLADLSDHAGDLGIDAMLPGLQPSGEYDETRSGVPLYGGVRVVIYKKSDFAKANITEVPTSLAEFEEAASKLQAANAGNANYSAFYFPGKYWYGALPFVWDAGGDIAAQDDSGTWAGTFNTEESQAGLTTLKNLVDTYSKAPKDGDETKNTAAFNTGNVGMMIDSWWAPDSLDKEGEPFSGDIGVFALPGTEPGSTSPVFFGGSDVAISEKSPNKGLALEWLKILTGTEIQTQFAKDGGVIPNQEAAFAGHEGRPFLQVADEASTNSKFTPVSPYWGNVESSAVIQDMLVQIFTGAQPIDAATAAADERITSILNGGS